MQNISFLVIVGVLLSCAFFFSEQVRVADGPSEATPPVSPTVGSLEDVPDCSDLDVDSGLAECSHDAARFTETLVEEMADQILSAMPDSAKRMAFLEIQNTWGQSRDADCEFIQGLANNETQGEIDRDLCLVDRNLARFDQLEVYFGD